MSFFVTIVAYVAVLLGVGLWKSRTTKTQDEFMVAGRTVSTWYLVGTLVCTWIGSGSLFGGAGLAFREGIGDLWMSAGAWVGIAIVYFLAESFGGTLPALATSALAYRIFGRRARPPVQAA